MFPNPSQIMQQSAIPVSLPVTNALLSSSVTIDVPDDATGVMVQCSAQDVHFRVGTGQTTTLTATTSDFRISVNNLTPVIIPLPPGGRIAFIENAATATLVYAFVR